MHRSLISKISACLFSVMIPTLVGWTIVLVIEKSNIEGKTACIF